MSFGPVNFDNPAQCVGSSYLVTLITESNVSIRNKLFIL